MRFLYGCIAFGLWAFLLTKAEVAGVDITDEIAIYSLAIITAGAMAGGG